MTQQHSDSIGEGAMHSLRGRRSISSALLIGAAWVSTGCMGPGHMMGGMMAPMPMKDSTHAGATHDSTTRATHASLIARADALVRRTEEMTGTVPSVGDAHAMPAGGGDRDPAQAMPARLHQLSTGVRALLRQLEAMRPAGNSAAMPGDRQRDMTEMLQAAETLVTGLERAVLAADRLRRAPSGHQ